MRREVFRIVHTRKVKVFILPETGVRIIPTPRIAGGALMEDIKQTMTAIRDDIEQAVERRVRATLLAIGIDVANPLQAQRDFVIMREISRLAMDVEFRKDLEHTRRWRLAMEAAQSKGFLTIVGLVVTGTATAVIVGLQAIFGRQ